MSHFVITNIYRTKSLAIKHAVAVRNEIFSWLVRNLLVSTRLRQIYLARPMRCILMIDETAKNLPDHIPVTVIMEKQPARSSQWVDHIWVAIGVIVSNSEERADKSRVADIGDDVQLKMFSGYQVRLHVDECDSYYHNLMSPTPQCFVIVREDEYNDEAIPFIVSLSFDEAHAYLEGDDAVFSVDIPPELYRWMEAFVIKHYCPEERKKRKRRDWKEKESEAQIR